MNTCGKCKYFGEAYEHEVWEAGEVTNTVRYHFCELLKHLNGSDDEDPRDQQIAGVIDGSGYCATMCVTEEFGCNQWEAK